MSKRWQNKLVEVPFKMLAGKPADRVQAELDRMGAQGWELVAVIQASTFDPTRMFFKKEA